MSNQVTLGGDRLGAGNKNKVSLHGYERSTHDLSYTWRSTMAAGTLVPFMSELALPGDTFDIKLNTEVLTHPTIGPLFGSYKVQLDVFQVPIRLYNGKLHMNMLNIGLDMQNIFLPQVVLQGKANAWRNGDNSQINASCIFNYLGIPGIGKDADETEEYVTKGFNAVPYLAYFDIYKQYYANKQEEHGVIVHNYQNTEYVNIVSFVIDSPLSGPEALPPSGAGFPVDYTLTVDGKATINLTTSNGEEPNPGELYIDFVTIGNVPITEIFEEIEWTSTSSTSGRWDCSRVNPAYAGPKTYEGWSSTGIVYPTDKPRLTTFPLSEIDDMRVQILQATGNSGPFEIASSTMNNVYTAALQQGTTGNYSLISNQEGLLIKTYQSDLFNNWISTEWIEGPNGINEITSVDTSTGSFTIDSLQLSRKVYDMLNRIAISGGTYDDWLNAVYTHERTRSVENPMYMGGLIKELAFQEVVSNAAAIGEGDTQQPLGTLAGRGILTNKHKGGDVYVKVDEPSYIIGIVSLTPRIDYSQGIKWDCNLLNLNELHKPAMDEIGFQDLITSQMHWAENTKVGVKWTNKSAGKQPAWINYMTNYNRCYGNFAVQEGTNGTEGGQMYMTLNRRYELDDQGNIKDLTTYIDPSKFNNIFADTRLDAQNFWTQIHCDITARRKMSAKIMPNL